MRNKDYYNELFELVKDEKDEYGYNGVIEMIKNSDENYTKDFVKHIMKMFDKQFNKVRTAKHGEEEGFDFTEEEGSLDNL